MTSDNHDDDLPPRDHNQPSIEYSSLDLYALASQALSPQPSAGSSYPFEQLQAANAVRVWCAAIHTEMHQVRQSF